MYALLLSVFGLYGIELPARPEQRDARYAPTPASVVLVVDGSSAWPGQAANKLVDQFATLLGPGFRLAVVRFDAEPALQSGAVRPRNRELVVAHDQFYPTSVSKGRLLELARSSDTAVHAIELVAWLKHAIAGLVERVALRERSYSTGETEHLLNGMADTTGGKFCIATGEQGGIDAASSIATGIVHACRMRYTE